MNNFRIEKGLDFNDVLVKPIPSEVNSRSDFDTSIKLSDSFTLKFPLIASPMHDVVDANFASLLSDFGGIAILDKFYETEEDLLNSISILQGKNFGVSIGLNDNYYKKLLEYNPRILCIDLANGYIKSLLVFCEEVKQFIVDNHLDTLLMSGNVCTRKGAENLRDSGVDIIRYGIGGGAVCTTRNVTSIGIPQITALMDIYDVCNVLICSDGGLQGSGDFVKAIVAGADLAMAGQLFAETFESPAKEKMYGMASKRLHQLRYKNFKSIEGTEKPIKKKYSLEEFVTRFSGGICSAGTYLNARNLEEIRINGEFILTGKGSIKEYDE